MKWRKNKNQKKEKKRRFFKRKTEQESVEERTPETQAPQCTDNEEAALEHSEAPPEINNTEAQESAPPKKQKRRVFKKLKERLKKSRKKLSAWGKKRLDEDLLEMVEESLITADIGVETTMTIMDQLNEQVNKKIITSTEQLQTTVLDELMKRLPQEDLSEKPFYQPHVILVVGVNGVGKTTTIGKLASQWTSQGKKVIIGASDTFRAAAVEQLELWAEKASADIVRHKENADPAAVAFDTVQAAISRKADVAIIDTAGRLHTKKNLMEEIKKIRRSIAKKLPEAPHDIFLILDATTGQNAVSQAQLFHEALNITGIILTKLDGTARGGIVISIANTFDIPIKYIGIGESIDDLHVFDPELFVRALIEPE